MSDLQILLFFVAVCALWGGFLALVLWRIAKTKSMSESHVGRRTLKGFALLIGLGLPMMALLGGVLFFYVI